MNNGHHHCLAVRRSASGFLDGRLDAAARGRLQQHLHACPACLRSLQRLARLSRATHNLPPHRVPSDLASRVRRSVAERRERTVSRLSSPPHFAASLLVAAAALVAVTAWSVGYRDGRHSLAGAPPTPVVAPAIASDPTFVAASRDLLRDLALTPALPARARRPLIASELAFFELEPRARQLLATNDAAPDARHLARFVVELAAELGRTPEPDWQAWQQRAHGDARLSTRIAPLPMPASDRPPSRRPIAIVVDHYGQTLSRSEQGELAEFLLLKQEQVTGDCAASVAFAERWQQAPGDGGAFALATRMTSAQNLAGAGFRATAEDLFAALRQQLQDDRSGNPAATMLEQMMRELGERDSNWR